MRGWVNKKGSVNKTFKRRYLQLVDSTITYHMDPSSAPKGEIVLTDESVLEHVSGVKGQSLRFSITPAPKARAYVLECESDVDLAKWLGAIKTQITNAKTQAALLFHDDSDNLQQAGRSQVAVETYRFFMRLMRQMPNSEACKHCRSLVLLLEHPNENELSVLCCIFQWLYVTYGVRDAFRCTCTEQSEKKKSSKNNENCPSKFFTVFMYNRGDKILLRLWNSLMLETVTRTVPGAATNPDVADISSVLAPKTAPLPSRAVSAVMVPSQTPPVTVNAVPPTLPTLPPSLLPTSDSHFDLLAPTLPSLPSEFLTATGEFTADITIANANNAEGADTPVQQPEQGEPDEAKETKESKEAKEAKEAKKSHIQDGTDRATERTIKATEDLKLWTLRLLWTVASLNKQWHSGTRKACKGSSNVFVNAQLSVTCDEPGPTKQTYVCCISLGVRDFWVQKTDEEVVSFFKGLRGLRIKVITGITLVT